MKKQERAERQERAEKEERDGLARLRAAIHDQHELSRKRGAEAGRAWALKKAHPTELARLYKAAGRRVAGYAAAAAADSRGAATRLHADVTGAPPGQWIDPDDVSDFWGAHADDLVNATAVEAFVRAALAVWGSCRAEYRRPGVHRPAHQQAALSGVDPTRFGRILESPTMEENEEPVPTLSAHERFHLAMTGAGPRPDRRAERARLKAERRAAKLRRANQVLPAPHPESALAVKVRAALWMGPCPTGCGPWTLRLDAYPTDRAQLGAFADWLDEQTGDVSLKSHLLRALALFPAVGGERPGR